MDKNEEIRSKEFNFDSLVTANQDFLEIIDRVKKMALSDLPVCLTGEAGTGKSALAMSIHSHSHRSSASCEVVDCVNLSSENLSAAIKEAEGGTLILDQVHMLDWDEQGKLLKMCQNENQDLIPRLLALSTENLPLCVKKGNFREDLYARMSQLNVVLPPLSQRKEDVALLIQYFIGEFNAQFQKQVECVSNVALSYLINYDWPGNVDELRAVVKTAVALSERNILWLEDVPLKITLTNESLMGDDNKDAFSLKHMEKEHISKVLKMCRWNKSKASNLLKVSRPRLDRKIKEFQLKKPA